MVSDAKEIIHLPANCNYPLADSPDPLDIWAARIALFDLERGGNFRPLGSLMRRIVADLKREGGAR